jgi:hypothetical protein
MFSGCEMSQSILPIKRGTRDHQTLSDWCFEAIMDEEFGRCSRIHLVHMRGEREDGVYTMAVSGKWTPQQMGEMFDHKARTYSQDMGATGSGIQQFALLAFYTNTATNEEESLPRQRHPFVVRSNLHMSSDGVTEGPAGSGPMSQDMRHKEANMALLFRRQSELDNTFIRAIQLLGDQLHRSQEALFARDQALLAMQQREADRTHEFRMEELRHLRESEERAMWIRYLPAIANTVLGKEVFPAGAQDTALMTAIAENVSEDHIKMLSMLPGIGDKPEIWGPLSARLRQIIKEKNDRAEAKIQAVERIPRRNAFEDAIGGSTAALDIGQTIHVVESSPKNGAS